MRKLVKLDNYTPYGKHTVYPEDIDAVKDILQFGWLTQGSKIDEFEKIISEYHDVKHAVVVNNGTSALYLAYLANNMNANSTLLTTGLTFLATVNSAKMLNANVKLVDIDSDTWNISIDELSQETNYTHVSPVHFAGLPNKMDEISKIATEKNAVIIEDAAHALGAEYKGYKIGSKYSKSTIFSFHPVKHVAAGEGGAIITNDDQIAERIRKLRSHGIIYDNFKQVDKLERPYYYEMNELSLNFRIPDILCGLGISQFKRLKENILERNRQAKIYRDLFDSWGKVVYQQIQSNSLNSYHIFPIKFKKIGIKNRDKLFVALRKLNIGVQVHYIPVHLHPYHKNIMKNDLPHTMDYYENCLTIPLYPGLEDEVIFTIFENIKILYGDLMR